jgi:group II intron reverse transcriptase/maturase
MKLIGMYLRAGAVMEEGVVIPRGEGTPQGGPLSPLLSNLYLDELDKELERRGHRFVRYADDCNIYVKSERAGERVKENIQRWIEKKLKLKVNENKSAVDGATKRKFLGFSFTMYKGEAKIRIAKESLKRLKREVRRLTYRTRGCDLSKTIQNLNRYLQGWIGYYGINQTPSVLEQIEGWIRRRLRAIIWKQWKTCKRRREAMIKLGVNKSAAAKAAGSSLGSWFISHIKAVQVALPAKYFQQLGLQPLVTRF